MEESQIKAFGLTTRVWTYHTVYGYGCAECCTGDRCDEDCTAKYKGRRKDCPHCKGKGWIQEEDINDPEPEKYPDSTHEMRASQEWKDWNKRQEQKRELHSVVTKK